MTVITTMLTWRELKRRILHRLITIPTDIPLQGMVLSVGYKITECKTPSGLNWTIGTDALLRWYKQGKVVVRPRTR